MKAKAFAPAHISGFFSPVFSTNGYEKTGSCGAGVCLSLGATTEALIEPAIQQQIQIFINGKRSTAPVTRLALQYLLGSTAVNVNVRTKLDLPMGQGFGLSAAGALSSATAVASALQIPFENSLKAAHCAEVQLKTGLGDVLASHFGGFEIRRSAGLPPWGMIEHIPGDFSLVLCVIGKKMQTNQVLADTHRLERITSYGRLCTKKLLEHPSVETFMRLSYEFSVQTHLINDQVHRAVKTAQNHGLASMCMLGNALFAIGDTEKLCQVLLPFGKIIVCTVDQSGVRVLL